MRPTAILETCLYAPDLDAAEAFYSKLLGLELYSKQPGRQLFYRCGQQMLLIFDPKETVKPLPADAKLPVPPHGATGQGHVCFAATAEEIARWKIHLELEGVVIEADFQWPGGGRSLYVRDPAGNCVEMAEKRIWKL